MIHRFHIINVLLLSTLISNPFVLAQSVDTLQDSTYVSDGILDRIIVSNVFYETDLRQALDDLAAQSGVLIIADNTVQGYVTMEINELSLRNALSRILTIGGYAYKWMGDYVLVGAMEPSNPTFLLLSETEAIPVNFIPAETAAELLSDSYRPYIKANAVLNMINVTASKEVIKKIREDLRKIDIPPKQVMIEAIVTEVKDGSLKSVGIDWSLFGEKEDGSALGANANLSPGLVDTLGSFFGINSMFVGTLGDFPINVMTELRALVQTGDAEIKANPKIVTTNAQPAVVYIAKEQYFSVVSGPVNYPYTTLEKIAVGIRLEITPFISENNLITVKIVPSVSDAIGYGREGLPVIDTRMVDTTVRVKDGGTITIGGLTQETVRETRNKIPILGSIPILGYIFSHTKRETLKTDIVILITPTIRPSAKFFGTDHVK